MSHRRLGVLVDAGIWCHPEYPLLLPGARAGWRKQGSGSHGLVRETSLVVLPSFYGVRDLPSCFVAVVAMLLLVEVFSSLCVTFQFEMQFFRDLCNWAR